MVEETLRAPYSHYLFDTDLSQQIDQRTINEMDIDGFTLMEIAGSSAAKKILEDHKLSHGIFLCGKGNNAGDALVVARYLMQHNITASVVFLSGMNDLSSETRKNLKLLKKFDTDNKITIYEQWEKFQSNNTFDFIVDGMLGTGLDSSLRGDYTKAVHWANKQSQPILAMDIPSGINGNTGKVMGTAVEAHTTYTFGGRKQGLYLNQGPVYSGYVDYCELPFPNKFKDSSNTFLLDDEWLSPEPSTPGRHKYESGVLYIIAGSEGLTGAAIMAAQSAWAEGLGAVILICPRGILPIYEQTLPSIIKKPVGSRNDYFFTDNHTEQVANILSEKEGVLLVGPGLGRNKSTVTFTGSLLVQNNYPTVIDADGLWCLAQLEKWAPPKETPWILTPHPGELSRLVGSDADTEQNRLSVVREYAQTKNVTILSKGMPGIVGTPSGKCYLTNYNTHYFARAGSGDVLAGKVSAYLALKHTTDKSSCLGLLNGKKKLEQFLNQLTGLPEPNDFI